jgi:hypothetical protein
MVAGMTVDPGDHLGGCDRQVILIAVQGVPDQLQPVLQIRVLELQRPVGCRVTLEPAAPDPGGNVRLTV